MAEAQDRKVMAAETQQESVLPESLLAVVGFNIKGVRGKLYGAGGQSLRITSGSLLFT